MPYWIYTIFKTVDKVSDFVGSFLHRQKPLPIL